MKQWYALYVLLCSYIEILHKREFTVILTRKCIDNLHVYNSAIIICKGLFKFVARNHTKCPCNLYCVRQWQHNARNHNITERDNCFIVFSTPAQKEKSLDWSPFWGQAITWINAEVLSIEVCMNNCEYIFNRNTQIFFQTRPLET